MIPEQSTRSIKATELVDALRTLESFFEAKGYSAYPAPNITAALAYCLGVQEGKRQERRAKRAATCKAR